MGDLAHFMATDPVYWWWFIIACVLIILEIFIPGVYLIWIGVAAIVMGSIVYFISDISMTFQVLIFAILIVATVVTYSLYKRKYPVVVDEVALNRKSEQYIGKMLTLTEAIVNGSGKVKVNDAIWKVTCSEDMPVGRPVRVVGVENTILVVAAVDTDN